MYKMYKKERRELYDKIVERAEKEELYIDNKWHVLTDIRSADLKFNLRLDDWLKADKSDFLHDLYGIMNNIVRDEFPATDFGSFVPKFAGIQNKNITRLKKIFLKILFF